ncbi:hypothetical protein M0804_013861 [Polistes exclamans]|nr:hypothetical protein M0804_013866 [Polistes exclamans]KAI4476108.1 hypothetical protein M0804_013861 [Polistes exclamans]
MDNEKHEEEEEEVEVEVEIEEVRSFVRSNPGIDKDLAIEDNKKGVANRRRKKNRRGESNIDDYDDDVGVDVDDYEDKKKE